MDAAALQQDKFACLPYHAGSVSTCDFAVSEHNHKHCSECLTQQQYVLALLPGVKSMGCARMDLKQLCLAGAAPMRHTVGSASISSSTASRSASHISFCFFSAAATCRAPRPARPASLTSSVSTNETAFSARQLLTSQSGPAQGSQLHRTGLWLAKGRIVSRKQGQVSACQRHSKIPNFKHMHARWSTRWLVCLIAARLKQSPATNAIDMALCT